MWLSVSAVHQPLLNWRLQFFQLATTKFCCVTLFEMRGIIYVQQCCVASGREMLPVITRPLDRSVIDKLRGHSPTSPIDRSQFALRKCSRSFRSISDWSQFAFERSHSDSDRFWLRSNYSLITACEPTLASFRSISDSFIDWSQTRLDRSQTRL